MPEDRRAAWSLLVLALAASAIAQAPPQAPTAAPTPTAAAPALPDLGPPAALPAGAPKHLQLIERSGLRKNVYWLADDARQGRFTSSRAQLETAKYVADQFSKLGLKPLGDKRGFLQSYPLEQLALDPATSLQVGTERIADHFAVLPAQGLDKLALAGRFVWCGRGRDDELPAALDGRIPLVVFDKPPRGQGVGGDLLAIQRYVDLANRLAKRQAAAAVIALPGDPGSLGNVLNYHGLMPDHPRLSTGGDNRGAHCAVPLFVVGGPAAEKLLRALGALDESGGVRDAPKGELPAGRLLLAVKSGPASACNVVALLEGRNKKAEAVVFSAHHDHIGLRLDGDAFNGADDNASGTAGLLAIALAFSKGGERPARSIVFLSVSGEELGLWGSRYFSEHPAWPLDKIVADVNVDMIGRCAVQDEHTVVQITPSFQHAKYSSIAQGTARLALQFGVQLASGDQYYQRSDHYNFAQKGVPVVFLCDGEHPDYHQVSDSADRLDYARMETIARLAFWTGWQVAEAKDRPTELGVQTDW
jgi:hypothetical protein